MCANQKRCTPPDDGPDVRHHTRPVLHLRSDFHSSCSVLLIPNLHCLDLTPSEWTVTRPGLPTSACLASPLVASLNLTKSKSIPHPNPPPFLSRLDFLVLPPLPSSRLHLSHHHRSPFPCRLQTRQPQTKQILAHLRSALLPFSPAHQRYPSLSVPRSIHLSRPNHHRSSSTSSILLLEHYIANPTYRLLIHHTALPACLDYHIGVTSTLSTPSTTNR
ncbi:hypothetical protein BDP55DRAFT_249864 [Colletotrichum godetiae]|uniref:Uncharacterized protein n=1 Tax=Colletotrichum godetiae TaxID=1209918 RepID=A0AAJ0AEI5_9PEZI|nr:uncharacterized protein BDP55DRAFT_249864 [Colletotrichum godetiae]KAK1672416.1 hypothetical protein BDP55DRAFT_249864 [Colletotrichum godetiae]